jgi:signal transduction histidine kinase
MFTGAYCFGQNESNLDVLLQKTFAERDSADHFFKLALKQLHSKADTANYYYFKFYQHDKSHPDSAQFYAERVLSLFEQLDTIERRRKIYERLYYQQLRNGNYDEALDYIQKALSMAEKAQDTAMISLHHSDLSVLFHDFEDYERGVRYGKRAYRIMDKAKYKDYKFLIIANNATAINFDDWKKPDSALFYHYKNLELLKKVEDSVNYGYVFNNIGNTLLKQERYLEAERIIKRALEINTIRGRDYNLATNYTNLATIAYKQGKNVKAREMFELANEFAQKSGSIEKIRDVVQQEAFFYKNLNDFKKALELQEQFYVLRDSVFNTERAAKIAEMETRFQTERKEKELAETRANLAESELEGRQKNTMILGSLGLAIILGLSGYLFYNQQKLKNKQLRKESELKQALARIETQNQLQEQRLRISRDLHDNIGSQLTFIISSVDNLKFRLKDTAAATTEKLSGISAFTTQTIYELRDTIWAMNKNDISWEDLQVRISNYIEKAGKVNDNIAFSFTVPDETATNKQLTSVQGMNVYRIIQEAVNNALKHSEATKIEVNISSEASQTVGKYTVIVSDNGKGFSEDTVKNGNGLSNIRKRAKELGASIDIISDTGSGTRVVIQFTA